MKPLNLHPATLLSIVCFASLLLISVFGPSVAGRAPSRTPKCTVDLAAANGSACTLAKATDDWILWSNTSSKPLSVHFKLSENPFMEKSCWDVDAGARARSGPIARAVAPNTYVAYSSDVSCAAKPPSDTGHVAAKIVVQ
jgi:hypothetical protein